MSDGLKRLPPRFLADNERFRGSGIESPLSLRDYWRWSASSLMDNTARGLVAEFLVATALKGYIPDQPRVEWDAYDFVAKIDGRKVSIEVKSSAYVQSWEQRRYSNLQFNIRSTRKPIQTNLGHTAANVAEPTSTSSAPLLWKRKHVSTWQC